MAIAIPLDRVQQVRLAAVPLESSLVDLGSMLLKSKC